MARRSTFPLACCSSAAALLVPASASAAYGAFRSPTRRLGCAFYSDGQTPRTVRCECSDSDDRAFTLRERGWTQPPKIGDTAMDPKAKVLAYGRTTSFAKLRRTSRRTGITCRSRRSGHGSMVSVRKQRVF